MFVFCVVGIDLRLEFEGKVKCGKALAGVGCCLASLDGMIWMIVVAVYQL